MEIGVLNPESDRSRPTPSSNPGTEASARPETLVGPGHGDPSRVRRLPPRAPLPPAGVIFDMDGVLADTREYHLRAFQELGALRGATMTAERFQTMFGLENSVFLPKMFGRPLDPADVRQMADWKEARYRQLIAGAVTLLPGVRELIAWLRRRKIPLAVASSAPRVNIEQILCSAGLESDFQAALAAEDVTRHKPFPDVFRAAAQRLGVEPARAWVFEDSHHGLEAARAAGIFAIAVATTHAEEDLALADVVYPDLSWLARELDGMAG